MKKKDLKELSSKSLREIRLKIAELEREKVKSNLELSMGKNKNIHEISVIKKNIAQAKTIESLKSKLENKEEGKGKINASN